MATSYRNPTVETRKAYESILKEKSETCQEFHVRLEIVLPSVDAVYATSHGMHSHKERSTLRTNM